MPRKGVDKKTKIIAQMLSLEVQLGSNMARLSAKYRELKRELEAIREQQSSESGDSGSSRDGRGADGAGIDNFGPEYRHCATSG